MARRYHQTVDGETFQIADDGVLHVACCDCGLIHKYVFKVKRGKIYQTVFRSERRTASYRREHSKRFRRTLRGVFP